MELQKLFFYTFPGGKPGVGLLLLRGAVGVTAMVQGGVYVVRASDATFGRWAVGWLAVASGACLVLGLLTKVVGAVVGVSSVGLAWVPASLLNTLDARLSVCFVVIISVSLILLGPGAFSLDARLFGRREIIIPYPSRSSKS